MKKLIKTFFITLSIFIFLASITRAEDDKYSFGDHELNFFSGMLNNDIHPAVPDEASRRAQQRQEEFNKMEARLRQMDYHMNERSPARQFLQNQI